MSSLVVLAMLVPLFGWIFELPDLIELRQHSEPIKANTVVATLLLGVVLLALELDNRRVAWLAAIPALVGALSFAQDLTGEDLYIDELSSPTSSVTPAPRREE
ncbi:MAG: hypothetical protein J6386_22895 [Candidatus Synoicihabitans palmerolidicus]|nr:hypothetical protein [Candidatus Synoicihabitans palmerolidicus]